jgi:uncharacterized repeat protein (TIGR01451 family)
MPHRLLLKLLCLFLLLWAGAGQAAPVPAGTVIRNMGTGTYVDAVSGLPMSLRSNTVDITVSALEALTLTVDQTALVASGMPFTLSHVLTNTGNALTAYRVTASVAPGGAFIPVSVQVVHDLNGNGRADAGEPVIPAGTPVSLEPGARANLLMTAQAPVISAPGQTAQLVIAAVSQLQGATAKNTDTVTLTSGAAVQVTLAASAASTLPRNTFSFTATASNNSTAAAAPVSVSVNGQPSSLFVLRIPLPANVTFAAAQASTTPGAQTLYHVLGAPANSYVTTAPAAAEVDAVAWGLASLPRGGNLQGEFSMTTNANAAGTVKGIAYADWIDQAAPLSTASNAVLLSLPEHPVGIGFFTGSTFTTPSLQNTVGNPLFVQADAAACNTNPTQINSVPITLVSQLTGDMETYTGVETGPNTGLFRILPNVPTANAALRIVASGNGILEVLRDDVLTATTISCGGIAVSATTTLLIDPSGVVYDSRTGKPVAGVTVQLIDVTGSGNGGKPGGPATVFQVDLTAAPSQVVTGADGYFIFPIVLDSTYQLRLSTLVGYTFPSSLPPLSQLPGRQIDAQGSYGNVFTVNASSRKLVYFDVPVDPGATGELFIQKTASKTTAEVGDFVDYSIKLNNVTAVALQGTVVNDSLPAGFAYVKGSARLNGAPLADPAGGAGPRLQFALGVVAVSAQPVLRYRLRVGAGSQSGDGINTAQAVSGSQKSNRSSARVQVVGGVFSQKAYIIGKVFAECHRDGVENGVQDAGEPGIPGVRLFLEDGTYAVTDEQGKYSMYGLSPRTHVVKIDGTTLPKGATLEVLNNRHALDPASQFADLTHGELRKVDFAIAECTPAIQAQIAARRNALNMPAEILQAASQLLSSTAAAAAAVDGRTLPASGVLGLPGASPAGGGPAKLLPATTTPGAAAGPAASAAALGAVGDVGGPYAPNAQGLPQPLFTPGKALPAALQNPAAASVPDESSRAMDPLENLLPELSPEVGFINLRHDQVLSTAQTRVRVKGPVGGAFELSVNGQPVPATQVGKKTSLEKTKTQAWEYIGINLKPGLNMLDVRATDAFGNVRGQTQITVLAPGPLAQVLIEAPQQTAADGATGLPVTIRLVDALSLPVTARMQVTLQSSLGQWQTPDLDPKQPGTQVFIEGGQGIFELLPPVQPGKAELSAASGTVSAAAKVEFLPNLRPMIAVGVMEGTINLRNLSPSGLQPAQSGDVFERLIRSASRSFDNGKGDVAARAALFLKGKVLGSTLLTLAYDSDKPSDTTLFRDIQPNQFYPVYGDSSARGFDAQSTGKLYVMVQNGTSYALLGDYSTQSDNPARQLMQYARALNGVKARIQEGAYTVEGFASRTSTTQLVEEFRANGTSGPFRLNLNGVVNSQQVNILTRDRNQPSVIVKDEPLTAFTDYELEPYSGQLLLKSPVPSLDADLNPVFIRVSYAVDSGGPKHMVAGAEARVQLSPGLTLGAVAVHDADPVNQQNLAGINLAAQLGAKTLATAEIARSSTDLKGGGASQRLEIRHDEPQLQARVWGIRTDAGFYNPNSPQSAGQSEYGAKAGIPLDEKNRVVVEALKTSNSVTGAEQAGAEIKLEHSLPGNARIEGGLRYSRGNAISSFSAFPLPGTSTPVPVMGNVSAAQTGYTSARAKLTVPVPNVPQADVFGVAEYAIDGSGGREVGLGGNYAVNPTTKLYLRHNFINSLGGTYNLNPAVSQYTTVAGINTELSASTQVFNEYRMGDSLNGPNSEASVGLRRLWRLDNALGITGSFQRIKPLSGVTTNDSTAITLGVEYIAAADWKGSAQVQWQTSTSSRSWLTTAALANKLDADWTALNRGLYSVQTNLNASGGERKLINLQSGFSYRPVQSNVWNALGRLQYKRDLDSTLGAGLNRAESSWTASTHVNIQPSQHWLITTRYAVKWANDRSSGLDSRSLTQLLGGRSTWDITERLDFGLQAYRMAGNGAAENALGIEAGYLVWKNLWLSLGYNVKGFRAADLAGDAYTQRGVYLRLRFKFDENVFSTDSPAVTE